MMARVNSARRVPSFNPLLATVLFLGTALVYQTDDQQTQKGAPSWLRNSGADCVSVVNAGRCHYRATRRVVQPFGHLLLNETGCAAHLKRVVGGGDRTPPRFAEVDLF